jgi:two-component system response regulator PilR (NtrC family)
MQVKLLRVLQEREFRRVGGTENVPLDIRLIAATNQDLSEMISRGAFREDLFYRLNVVSLELPALRQRSQDVPQLVEFFYDRITGNKGYRIEPAALEAMLNYSWPGNVRELENLVERCLVLGDSDRMSMECLPASMKGECKGDLAIPEEIPDNFNMESWLEGLERDMLNKALAKSGGVRKRAADLLGISFRSIRYRLDKLGIGDDNG